jgi:hypothetical protein
MGIQGEHGRGLPLARPHGVNGSNGASARELAATDLAIGSPPAPAMSRVPRSRGAAGHSGPADRELLAKRDRLIERFAAMQLDLGGVYYEMAIRDHVSHDVLTRKAAEMQRVDAELRQVEEVLDTGGSGANKCPACDALYAPGSAFCSSCGSSLAAGAPDPGR